jgi:hypothetical protein
MIALFLLLVIVAIVLGSVVVKGVLCLLTIGTAIFLGAVPLSALRMRRRPWRCSGSTVRPWFEGIAVVVVIPTVLT